MIGIIFGLLAACFLGLFDLSFALLVGRSRSTHVVLWSGLLSVGFLAPVGVSVPIFFSPVSLDLLFLSAAGMGLIHTAALLALAEAHTRAPGAVEAGPVARLLPEIAASGLPLAGSGQPAGQIQRTMLVILLSLRPGALLLFVLLRRRRADVSRIIAGPLRPSRRFGWRDGRNLLWTCSAFGCVGLEYVLLIQVPMLLVPVALLLARLCCCLLVLLFTRPVRRAGFVALLSDQHGLLLVFALPLSDILAALALAWGAQASPLWELAALAPTAPLFTLVLVWITRRRLPRATTTPIIGRCGSTCSRGPFVPVSEQRELRERPTPRCSIPTDAFH